MAYTPTNWTTGDTITATAMNKIENGIADARGHDAEIILYHDENSSSDWECTIVSGDYASIAAMVSNDIAPDILVKYTNLMANSKISTSAITIYYYFSSVSVPYIRFMFFDHVTLSNNLFDWLSDDTIEVV